MQSPRSLLSLQDVTSHQDSSRRSSHPLFRHGDIVIDFDGFGDAWECGRSIAFAGVSAGLVRQHIRTEKQHTGIQARREYHMPIELTGWKPALTSEAAVISNRKARDQQVSHDEGGRAGLGQV